ncbi:hypothetical protein [Dendronalium sp. ChiSLP03b]
MRQFGESSTAGDFLQQVTGVSVAVATLGASPQGSWEFHATSFKSA